MAYTAIEEAILTQRLPPGAILDESQLAQRLGVSRTPIREAIQRLAQEGLVVKVPRRGTIVTSLTASDVANIDMVRLLLEPPAARLAATRVSRSSLDRLEGDLDRLVELQAKLSGGDGSDQQIALFALSLDSRIHRTVLESTGNPLLARIVMSLHNRLGGVRGQTVTHRIDQFCREHRNILGSLQQGDPAGAETAMREHLIHAVDTRVRQTTFSGEVVDSSFGDLTLEAEVPGGRVS